MPDFQLAELSAAIFQTAVLAGLAGFFAYLYRRYGKIHFFWWAIAFGLYSLAPAAIVTFILTEARGFLYWHQIIIGWTALGFLYAALVFARHGLRWRWWYLGYLAFPVGWAYIAIFVLESFALAAGPMVGFLALTTGWTGVVFWRYRKRTGSAAAGFLAVTLLLWGLHHLDYPILRARGAWSPWGYMLDTVFVLATGAGIMLLIFEELREGLGTLVALSGDLRREGLEDSRAALLARPLALRGVDGAALLYVGPDGPVFDRGVGICRDWGSTGIPATVRAVVAEAMAAGKSRLVGESAETTATPSYTGVIRLGGTGEGTRVLVISGDLAASFAALDESLLEAVGEQIGSALERSELSVRLEQRTADLERLSVRMLSEHEEQRRRLGRELHDETAQVFSALKLQLGTFRESAPVELSPRVDRLVELVDAGTRSIRSVTDDLRPAVLEDLGVVPALRALISDFREWSGLTVTFEAPAEVRGLSSEAELALFRTLQEALSNVARHAHATRIAVHLQVADRLVTLSIEDDGDGLSAGDLDRLQSGPGRSGLFGMRERIIALGGSVMLRSQSGSGVSVAAELPLERVL